MKVVLRFEVGPASVIEHAMRSLTLGEELQGCGHEVIAATEGVSSFAERRSAAAVIEIREISNVRRSVRFVEQLAPDAIVFDGYGLGVTINALAADGHQLVVIDDNAELPVVDAAIVVNQNLHVGAATRFLLWPDYALLRPDVVRLGQEPACRERSSESRLAVLVAMGRHRPASDDGSARRSTCRHVAIQRNCCFGCYVHGLENPGPGGSQDRSGGAS